ncbi:MAG: hypothetical protein HY392_00995 [Candidatus Diapherotrites archaeon]|nr:hypothetical protein [Candidatus Diapherotrites archaeon]
MKPVLLAAAFALFLFGCIQTPNGACTLEAKLCPDGSAVGRTGPNCEFSPCPEVKPGACSAIAQELGQKIEQANYCTTDSDCTTIDFSCPFVTCGKYVNMEKASGLEQDYQRFSNCSDGYPVYCAGCIQIPKPVCVAGKCISP